MKYNKKGFLLPESPNSMACYHAKIDDNGLMKLTIHDCNGSIRLHNDLSTPEGEREAIDKLTAMIDGLSGLKKHIIDNKNGYRSNNQMKPDITIHIGSLVSNLAVISGNNPEDIEKLASDMFFKMFKKVIASCTDSPDKEQRNSSTEL